MLIPIGRFARAARLSIKSLRNYDESGLLPAAFIDPQSGYRYYRLEQLVRAEAIRSLRMVDMPLPEITRLLDSDDPEQLLMSHLASLENQRDELNLKAQQLQRRISRKEYVMSTKVTTKVTPTITAVAHRRATTYPGILDDIPAGFGIVMEFLTEAGIDPVGAPFTLYHQVPDADTPGDIAMCIPVAAAMQTDEETQVVEVTGGAAASIIHQGSYDDMGESYATVSAWIHERGHRIVSPHREVYLNNPADVSEADLLTEILFPIDAEGEL